MLCDGLTIEGYLFPGLERLVAQPFVQRKPAIGVFEREPIGAVRLHLARARPAQQPVLPVRQDALADAFPRILRLFEVTVQLFDVIGVGSQSAGGADPPLEFDERIQRGEVYGAAGAVRWRILLDDLSGICQPRERQERRGRRS